MNYILLVSHGTIAEAMHETLKAFFVGDRPDLMYVCLKEGMSPDEFAGQVREILADIRAEDDLTVLADLMGGSPLTYASCAVSEMGLLERTSFLCGMNLPMVLELLTGKEHSLRHSGSDEYLQEARNTIRPFSLPPLESLCGAEMI